MAIQADLRNGQWTTVFEAPFMNSGKSKLPGRAFFLPGPLGEVVYDTYRVSRNNALFDQ